MSNRRDSMRRVRQLNRATKGRTFSKDYKWAGEKRGASPLLKVVLIILILAVVGVGVFLCVRFGSKLFGSHDEPEVKVVATQTPAPTATPQDEDDDDFNVEAGAEQMPNTATFLQGPRGWKTKTDWAGEWGDKAYDGRRFAGFGCGFCVMANFYTSFTPYQCSPVDMYKYAKKVTNYEGRGAIDWVFVSQTLSSLGFTTDTGRKPKRFRDFEKKIEESLGAMVVISSNYDDSYWKDTPGHYVTILGYDADTKKVFLGDSGDLDHNRSWVPLKTVYKAIKLSNSTHYLRVLAYSEAYDQWKHKKISGTWCRPEYFTK